jgi:hypothetical protein
MNREELINVLHGISIKTLVLEGDNQNPPFKIVKIITPDGRHINLESGEVTHPAYEKELAEFLERVNNSTPESSFSMRINELRLDEMRQIATEHARKINANGGNVNEDNRGDYRVRFGEDLDRLRR